MRHTLRKYLSNRGSALFMVLSTMTALMVCCMAMYFSVVSSRSTQYATFYQQQAYQSAASLSDTVIAGLMGNPSTGFGKLGALLTSMTKVGDVRTTSANGFISFGDTAGKEDDSQAGAYMMTITRLNDETDGKGNQYQVFDIVITSSVNGTKEVFHNIIQFEPPSSGKQLPGPTNVFTATGYVPNDVYLNGGIMRTDVFFDNEHTILKAYSSSDLNIHGNLSCAGSLDINAKIKAGAEIGETHPVTYAIRGDYNNKASGEISLISGSTVMIGGNCEGKAHFGNSNIYILGDLILNYEGPDWNTWTGISSSSKYFVNGNIIIKGKGSAWVNLSNMYCNQSVIKEDGVNLSGNPAGKWDGVDIEGVMTKDQMINTLEEKTATNTYYKWIIDSSKLTGGVKDLEYVVDTTYTDAAGNKKPQKYTHYIEYGSKQDGTGCTIEDITMRYNNTANEGYRDLTLVIDTGDNADNVYTINLQGNRDYLPGPVVNETFCWFPNNKSPGAEGCSTYNSNGKQVRFQVLIMGRGSVLFNVPDGIIYQDDDEMKVMHYGWYVLDPANTETFLGDSKAGLSKRDIIENTVYSHANGSNAANIYPKYVHSGCRAGDGCVYTEKKTTEACPVCNEKTVQLECDNHGVIDTYCKKCQPSRGLVPCKDHTEYNNNCDKCKANLAAGKCSNRIDKAAIDAYLASNSAAKDRMLGKDGKVIYPNVNLFIISCDENANIRFASAATSDPDEEPVPFMHNSFFGYIYAPYMTFKATVNDPTGASYVRMAGGMTVSDYIIDDSYTFMAIWPDKVPEELMGESSFKNPLAGLSSKSWKVSLVGR